MELLSEHRRCYTKKNKQYWESEGIRVGESRAKRLRLHTHYARKMDGLPELVKAALNQACGSGRSLSWKLQESEKGTLLQLVWKAKVEQPSVLEGSDGVGSNWKYSGRRRISPSRARRNVRRRKAFLEKRAAVVSQKGLGCGEKGKERCDGGCG